ncbi:MAG TPA: NADH-quinone oxidoreductase subunit L [Acidobacteriaceae bacterium]|jgi:NADH-quinone oxidoreductase subunit L|nr:NADH-quinone oxidoreductase subunit L [Acidobacteriaceae bacterium]
MNLSLYLWLIPALPFAGFLINGFLGSRLPKALVSAIALAFPLGALAVVVRAALMAWPGSSSIALPYVENFGGSWINAGALHIDFTFALDQLTLIMLLIITGVGFLIHIYSVGYMAHEEGYWRYFAYLNLFLFFMLILVLAENYLLMFVGWEGVGLASYLLIGFYLDRKSAADAGRKAFVVNRVGDFGFLLGMFLLLANFGSLSFAKIGEGLAAHPNLQGGQLTAIAICLLIGACGKSAQIPLYIWLPDAMEGPTPVSALIHAATMVTAGVYMISRTHGIFDRSPFTLAIVAIIGAATAFFAATVALVQTDIKRVLAYSTISQLGYMFLGCGVAAYSAAVFHLMTHAFFKALLFLAAGSVIHGLSGEQDMRKMGGLRKKMPVTFWTMTMGVIAIAGIPPWAGFFSKDAILYEAFQHGPLGKGLYFVGLVTALLTSFYMFRLWYLTFMGESRAGHDSHAHGHAHEPHESPWSMLTPLVILATLSIVGGWIGIERFGNFLAPIVGPVIDPALESGGKSLDIGLSVVAVAVALIGWFIARSFYGSKNDRAAKLAASASGVYNLLSHKYWIDEIYTNTIVKPLTLASRYILGWIGEGLIIRGSAWLLGGIATLLGEAARRWQSGNLRSYSGWLAAGAAALLFFVVIGWVFGIGGVDIRMIWAGGH